MYFQLVSCFIGAWPVVAAETGTNSSTITDGGFAARCA